MAICFRYWQQKKNAFLKPVTVHIGEFMRPIEVSDFSSFLQISKKRLYWELTPTPSFPVSQFLMPPPDPPCSAKKRTGFELLFYTIGK